MQTGLEVVRTRRNNDGLVITTKGNHQHPEEFAVGRSVKEVSNFRKNEFGGDSAIEEISRDFHRNIVPLVFIADKGDIVGSIREDEAHFFGVA